MPNVCYMQLLPNSAIVLVKVNKNWDKLNTPNFGVAFVFPLKLIFRENHTILFLLSILSMTFFRISELTFAISSISEIALPAVSSFFSQFWEDTFQCNSILWGAIKKAMRKLLRRKDFLLSGLGLSAANTQQNSAFNHANVLDVFIWLLLSTLEYLVALITISDTISLSNRVTGIYRENRSEYLYFSLRNIHRTF